MPAQNLYQDLKNALQELKTFLDTNTATIAPAIQQIAALVPQVTEVIDQLIDLLNRLKTEIQNLDVSGIPALAEVSQFTTAVTTVLNTSKNLLPAQAGAIDDVLGVMSVLTGLPSLDDLKGDITGLITGIVANLNQLKPA
jgi:predicted PurR-regulated permease PerM